jgi:FkbM family methyltransferase
MSLKQHIISWCTAAADTALRLYPLRLHARLLRTWYGRLPANHPFDIKVDDICYRLSFGNYPMDDAIVERIQGRREPETMAIYAALVRPGNRVVEIGACYGEFTILLSNYVGQDGKVLAIEGTPNSFEILKHNLAANKVCNVEAINVFVANTTPDVAFAKDAVSPYAAIEAMRSGAVAGDERVPTVRLSELLGDMGFIPDIILMDIEGFEIDVFEDLDCGFLDTCHPVIVFETHLSFYQDNRDIEFIRNVPRRRGWSWRIKAGNMICFPP